MLMPGVPEYPGRVREGGSAAMKVLIADDHRLMLDAVRRALENDGFEVVGEAVNGSQVLPLVRRTNPDVVLLDLRMPQLDGLACIDAIKKNSSDIKVIVLSGFSETERIQAAFNRGADGYIVKNVNPLDLPAALRQSLEGTVYHPVAATGGAADEASKAPGLTERETSILKAVGRGLSNQAIAKEFWVTEQTVKFHLTNVYRKLGLANRTEAARYAYQRGLVDSPMYEYA
jgi:DNA-binding NarL/FixJ family response regulator